MSNTLSPTVQSQPFIKFKPGDVVNARGQIAVILDILESPHSDNMCLYIRFIHNIGNARTYDMLEISADRMRGVDLWEPATMADLREAVEKRRDFLDKQLQEVIDIAERTFNEG